MPSSRASKTAGTATLCHSLWPFTLGSQHDIKVSAESISHGCTFVPESQFEWGGWCIGRLLFQVCLGVSPPTVYLYSYSQQITMYVCDVHYSCTIVKEIPAPPACLRPMHAHAQYACSMCMLGAGSGLSDE